MKTLENYPLQLRSREVLPVIIGGMGVDISTAELALEAARLGCIGHISDAMSPYVSDKRFGNKYQHQKLVTFRNRPVEEIRWDPERVYQAQLDHIGSTMNAKRGSGMVFVNVMEKLTMGAPKETLKARLAGAMDAGIDGITLSAGLHMGTLALAADHPRFRDVMFGIIVSSARALKIFLRGASRLNRLPDYIVVEGPLAGGHLGFGEDWREHDLRSIVTDVIALLRESDLQIPVVPAGGIFSGSDAVSYMELGASAVQVATRFTISQECGLPEHVKQIYLKANEDDLEVNMSSPSGYPMRMLKSSPSLQSNVKPNCESLGYLLDEKGHCAYRDAYAAGPVGPDGKKLPIREKMCICHHFMRHQCYTCGTNVYRLRDTTTEIGDGNYYLPRAEEILIDYLERLEPARLAPPAEEAERAVA